MLQIEVVVANLSGVALLNTREFLLTTSLREEVGPLHTKTIDVIGEFAHRPVLVVFSHQVIQ